MALLHEMVHNARIVWLDGRPHSSSRIRLYNGDSRGQWEGDMLVVETTNFGKDVYDPFRQGGGMRPNISGTFKLTERFRRAAPDMLIYRGSRYANIQVEHRGPELVHGAADGTDPDDKEPAAAL